MDGIAKVAYRARMVVENKPNKENIPIMDNITYSRMVVLESDRGNVIREISDSLDTIRHETKRIDHYKGSLENINAQLNELHKELHEM